MYSWGKSFATTGQRYQRSSPLVETRDITDLHARMLRGELDPAPQAKHVGRYSGSPTAGSIRPDGSVDESAVDYKMIARAAQKLKTRDLAVIEEEVRSQGRERFEKRAEQKGSRGDQTYWQYTISRFIRTQPNGKQNVRSKPKFTRKQIEIARASYGL
jgi:hypothetical protein